MLKIGLTGGIGSGKTTVSELFADLNKDKNDVAIIDTDIIAREIVKPGQPAYFKIVELFGKKILDDNAAINRKALRDIIFNDLHLKKKLEAITHPEIQQQVNQKVARLDTKYCIIVIPLLFETRSNYELDRILVIDCDKKSQLQRTTQRDGITIQDAERIIQTQKSSDYRLQHADDVITNNGSLEQLKKQVKHLHTFYLELAKTHKQ